MLAIEENSRFAPKGAFKVFGKRLHSYKHWARPGPTAIGLPHIGRQSLNNAFSFISEAQLLRFDHEETLSAGGSYGHRCRRGGDEAAHASA